MLYCFDTHVTHVNMFPPHALRWDLAVGTLQEECPLSRRIGPDPGHRTCLGHQKLAMEVCFLDGKPIELKGAKRWFSSKPRLITPGFSDAVQSLGNHFDDWGNTGPKSVPRQDQGTSAASDQGFGGGIGWDVPMVHPVFFWIGYTVSR